MQLSEFNKSRIRYHLGYYVVSVPAGDYARLEEAMNSVPDSVFHDKIVYQIGRCDAAERKTQLASYEDGFQPPSTRIEGIVGDVDRTIRSSNVKESLKVWDEVYLYETNRLAHILYVPNYKDPFQARYRYERSGAEFIQALPGPADTAHVFTTHVKLGRINSMSELLEVKENIKHILSEYPFKFYTIETELDRESCGLPPNGSHEH